jgi:hypothetical protein
MTDPQLTPEQELVLKRIDAMIAGLIAPLCEAKELGLIVSFTMDSDKKEYKLNVERLQKVQWPSKKTVN